FRYTPTSCGPNSFGKGRFGFVDRRALLNKQTEALNEAVSGENERNPGTGFVLLGTRQQGVPVILRELVLPDGFDLVSPSFTVRKVTTELSGPRLTSCRTEM
ncbi:unnamed protein product, partial [Schistosoma mattheei]